VKAYELARSGADKKELTKIQKLMADADAIVTKTGVIAGTKYALEYFYGYGGQGRRPIQPPTVEIMRLSEVGFKAIVDYENSI
jgi:L-threo-3-deoxy-hexylosonate aldolase